MKREEDFDDYPTLHLHLMVDDYEELFPEWGTKVAQYEDSEDCCFSSVTDRRTEVIPVDSYVVFQN